MKETTYAYLVLLYDDQTPSGVFTTETEARAAAERFLAAYWGKREDEIRASDYFSEDEKSEYLAAHQREKDSWKEDGFIDDLIYIQKVPLGKLISYGDNEY